MSWEYVKDKISMSVQKIDVLFYKGASNE